MPAVKLSRQEHLASLLWQVDDRVAFSYGDEDSPEFLYLTARHWLDMGKPKAITVTIEPGDSFNG